MSLKPDGKAALLPAGDGDPRHDHKEPALRCHSFGGEGGPFLPSG